MTLREAPDELVLGAVGRFWQPSGGPRRIEAAEFRDFDEPGFAKAAFNFEIEPAGGRRCSEPRREWPRPTSTRAGASAATGGSSTPAAR